MCYVAVPITTAEAGEAVVESAAADGAAAERLRGMRLLLVDDDGDSRDVAQQLLQAAGARVATASSVREAVSVLSGDPGNVDAVLADIGMPGEDGYAFIAGLRAAPDARLRTLPVVAVTAYASRSDRVRALAAGFDGHVPKPVAITALAQALISATTRRAAR